MRESHPVCVSLYPTARRTYRVDGSSFLPSVHEGRHFRLNGTQRVLIHHNCFCKGAPGAPAARQSRHSCHAVVVVIQGAGTTSDTSESASDSRRDAVALDERHQA